jgi:hypothetical protein
MAVMAIWASGGTVFQSGSGIGGRGIIALILRAYYTKGSARERAPREVTDQQIDSLSIKREKFHGEWNYTIRPK